MNDLLFAFIAGVIVGVIIVTAYQFYCINVKGMTFAPNKKVEYKSFKKKKEDEKS